MNELTPARAAAEWWASLLTQKHQHDAGDADVNKWANFELHQPLPVIFTVGQIQTFIETLVALIEQQPYYHHSQGMGHIVSVDYEPDQLLEAAAKSAGICLWQRLPIKTDCRVSQAEVNVCIGASGKRTIIWKKESHGTNLDH